MSISSNYQDQVPGENISKKNNGTIRINILNRIGYYHGFRIVKAAVLPNGIIRNETIRVCNMGTVNRL